MLLEKYDAIPTLQLLFKSTDALKENAQLLLNKIKDLVTCEIVETTTLIGGGSTPNKKIPSIAVTVDFKNYSPNKIQKMFREKKIIGRIENEKFLLDFRTIQKEDLPFIIEAVQCLAAS